MESMVGAKLEYLSRPRLCQEEYLLTLLNMDRSSRAFNMSTQHLSIVGGFAYTPQHREIYPLPQRLSNMLNGKQEIITNSPESLKFS